MSFASYSKAVSKPACPLEDNIKIPTFMHSQFLPMCPSASDDLQPKSSLDFSPLPCLPGTYNKKLYSCSLYFAGLNKPRLWVFAAQCAIETHQTAFSFSREK